MSAMKRNLQIVWDETTNIISDGGDGEGAPWGGRRYIARSLDGGTGWGVWDSKQDRFLKDREVRVLSEKKIRETWTN